MLSILASYAQEESLSASENQKWRIRKDFEQGKVSSLQMLGYKRNRNGVLEIIPEEAEIVRFIYKSYMEGQTAYTIAKAMIERKIPTPTGKEKWHQSTIKSILTYVRTADAFSVQRSAALFHAAFI